MKRIAIFAQNLNVGGIQKSLLNFLNIIDYNKYNVDLYLFSINNFYNEEINKNVKVMYFKASTWKRYLPFGLFLKQRFNFLSPVKYDISIDYDGYQYDTAYGALKCNSKEKVIWIHSDLEKRYQYNYKYRLLYTLSKKKFKMFDKFVFVSKGAKDAFLRMTMLETNKVVIIPNYVDTKRIIDLSKEPCDLEVDKKCYNLVALGRMVKVKGYDTLIRYLKEVVNVRQDIHLYFIGDGEEKRHLIHLISKYNLSDYVTMLGLKSNPYKYLKLMDGLIMTSVYEGQGLVTMEAKTLGLDVFINKNLEKYNYTISGQENLIEALVKAKKGSPELNKLDDYNEMVIKEISNLLK